MLLFCQLVSAQNEQVVKIEHADAFSQELTKDSLLVRKLVGNVRLSQDDFRMQCDSAIMNRDQTLVKAYGNVRMQKGDSVTIRADSLTYRSSERIALLYGNVRLSDKVSTVYTDFLIFNSAMNKASFTNRGKVATGSTRIQSIKGSYFTKTHEAYFKDSVRIVDPQYQLATDTLRYNSSSRIAYFYKQTEISFENSKITCNRGWFNNLEEIASFGEQTVLESDDQLLLSDSLYYDVQAGWGRSIRNFHWIDRAQGLEVLGERGWYFDSLQRLMVPDRPLLIYAMTDDSLFLSADTLKSEIVPDTTQPGQRKLKAYYDVRIFKSDLQAICDSLSFSFEDSVFRLYDNPVMWNGASQLTADTMRILLKNRSIDRLELRKSSFIATQQAADLYDQISGRDIDGTFLDGKLHRMKVNGNAESLYFGKNDQGAFEGCNKALADFIQVLFKDEQVNKISFIRKPEATFYPMSSLNEENKLLSGFKWIPEMRPGLYDVARILYK